MIINPLVEHRYNIHQGLQCFYMHFVRVKYISIFHMMPISKKNRSKIKPRLFPQADLNVQ